MIQLLFKCLDVLNIQKKITYIIFNLIYIFKKYCL